MNKKVHREETIDQIVELVRFHTTHNVFVAYDSFYYQSYRGNKGRNPLSDTSEGCVCVGVIENCTLFVLQSCKMHIAVQTEGTQNECILQR